MGRNFSDFIIGVDACWRQHIILPLVVLVLLMTAAILWRVETHWGFLSPRRDTTLELCVGPEPQFIPEPTIIPQRFLMEPTHANTLFERDSP